MKSSRLIWMIVAGVYAVPYLLLILLGSLWLWEHGFLWQFLGGLAALTAAAWAVRESAGVSVG